MSHRRAATCTQPTDRKMTRDRQVVKIDPTRASATARALYRRS